MVIDSSIRKLLNILEPRVWDLDDKKKHLEKEKEELESVSRFIAYTKDNMDMVCVYADQDLIINNLDKIYCSVDEYKASCYLLRSEDGSIKNLPQYTKACDLIKDIIEFFKLHKAELLVEIQELKNICQQKEIEKKYYDILSNSNPFVENVEEFRTMIDQNDLTDEDKINILIIILQNSVLKYESENE